MYSVNSSASADSSSSHGNFLILKPQSPANAQTIKFTALDFHPSKISVNNDFAWETSSIDTSKTSQGCGGSSGSKSFKNQKFVKNNSKTEITINGVIVPYAYFSYDNMASTQASPIKTLQTLRNLGLQGTLFKAYSFEDGGNSLGIWVLKSLSWDESNFQYASNAAKIDFTAHFSVNLSGTQYTSP